MAEPFAFVKVSDPDEPNHADLFIDRYNTVSGSKADMGFEAKRINAAHNARVREALEECRRIIVVFPDNVERLEMLCRLKEKFT